jgi:hypothetical protein
VSCHRRSGIDDARKAWTSKRHFRRAAQQSLQDALDEMTAILAEAKRTFVSQLEEFANASSKPIEEASTRSAKSIEQLNARVSGAMDDRERQGRW